MKIDPETPTIAGTARSSGDSKRVLPLVSDLGNRRVLEEWLADHEQYELVTDTESLAAADPDLCILDVENARARQAELEEVKRDTRAVLPYLLVIPESDGGTVHRWLRTEQPELWDLVDSSVRAPLERFELDDRVASLLRLRDQSRQLRRREEQLRQIRDEHAGHGVLVTDSEGKIEYVNPAFEEQSGYSSEEVVGESPSIVQSGEHGKDFYEDLWETITEGEVWRGEVVNERKDGERYILDQVIAPAEGPDGEIERFIAVNHDITELKELQESLRDQSEQLELLNRVLRHDIKNDASVILGWTDILADHVDSEGEPILDRIESSGRHIVELTTVARDLVDAVSSEQELELEPVSLTRILCEEVSKRSESFGEATIEGPEDAPEVTVCANEMLSSVFRNLINNAVQHTDDDDPSVDVDLRTRGDRVEVQVADRGPGVPDSVKEVVNADEVAGLETEETGMGLYLVQKLVDMYGGGLHVADNEPSGTVFSVEFETVDAEAEDWEPA